MIIANIVGGLGNQMFQYAAGLALANAKKTDLTLDLSDFESYQLHNGFELSRVFNISASSATPAQAQNVLGWRNIKIVRRLLHFPSLAALRGTVYVLEPTFEFWPGFFDLSSNVHLCGYWQSELYFINIAAKIRQEFAFKTEITDQNKFYAEKIQNCNAVSLHIRRGDYATNAQTNSIHGLLPIEYYINALKIIKCHVDAPNYFVFSDDIEWASQNLQLGNNAVYVGHNYGEFSYNDMRLMAMCKHHIVANSSFSWWGAWLNTNPEKIVIAPKRWFVAKNIASTLIPSTWKTI